MHSIRMALQIFSICSLVALTIQGCSAAVGRPNALDGGQEVKIFQVPYLVQLRDDNNKIFCAGTLVSPQDVVTSASCFDAMDYTKAVVVAAATTVIDEGQQRQISEITKHPQYSADTKQSNAAVLKLNEAFVIGRNIRPITLCKDAVAEGELVQTPGWGRMSLSNPVSDKVRSARIPVTSEDKCDIEFTASGEKKLFCVTGNPGLAHCVGDFGGPAVYRGKLCGIIAVGDKCSQPGESSGFTNVLDVKAFIESLVSFEPSF